MPLEPELIALMHHEVTLEAAGSLNKYGQIDSYGAPVTVKCYLKRMSVQAVDRRGAIVLSEVQAILADPTLVVNLDDRLTLPDGSQPNIIQILAADDDVGPYYLEVRA